MGIRAAVDHADGVQTNPGHDPARLLRVRAGRAARRATLLTIPLRSQAIVIGSGAGGAVTALELARAGLEVLVIEEGRRHSIDEYGQPPPAAMPLLYRRRGMTPIVGPVPIGYVEGCCVGGSTEINSGFWHRTPAESLSRWETRFELQGVSAGALTAHFEWAERMLSVSCFKGAWPANTQVLARGAERAGWQVEEVPRVVKDCACAKPCASGCSTGGKQSMSRSLLPLAEAAGARILTRCRALRLVRRGPRVIAVDAGFSDRGRIRLEADHVFVCAGPTETPALLRRSGITHNVGARLEIHPMLKVAARFPHPIRAVSGPLPLLQVTEFRPAVSIGGGYLTPGHLAMHFSENWPVLADRMADADRIAMFYVAVRGDGRGSVRPGWSARDTHLRYGLTSGDRANLERGLTKLTRLLLESGADEVYPCVQGIPIVRSDDDLQHALARRMHGTCLSLTTVHAFSTCPIGERVDRTAAGSYGQVHGLENLFVNDASMLPDSPGVNPQGSIMALARRNALHFAGGRA